MTEKKQQKQKKPLKEEELSTITITGKYAEAIIYTPQLDKETHVQIKATMDHVAFEGSKVRIMPDVHAGAGSVIGFTATVTDKVIPNIVGVDIGCGVLAINLGKQKFKTRKFKQFDGFVHQMIPSGFNINQIGPSEEEMKQVLKTIDENAKLKSLLKNFNQMATDIGIDGKNNKNKNQGKKDFMMRSLGTLGGGNHFIELDLDDQGETWLVIHTGSRNFGLQVAKFHQAKAVKAVGKMGGREYLEGENAKLYFRHMKIAQYYAKFQRRLIAHRILEGFFGLSLAEQEIVESVHNYINFEDRIIRKGAISAREGEKVVIPFNMAAGLIIGTGKGNPDWNNSAPHGAGRVMSRNQARKRIPLEKFQKVMKEAGVWSSCVVKSVIDEAPQVYKNVDEIMRYIKPTVNIDLILKPIYNFKAK
ncbi:RNA-splicing ligase rtcb [Anaeramoeba flamelloides]|uniref:3'-phosphate/5'-hydroxy nucleic acid ligase n=1 Tax=Anaeramoeba flamelloides TaxID=1746091 RepID=A0ABQ8X2C1_9EUKA|nr:RNA-splicing ligase rtcb [Anaeramoeba flamelloides]